MTKLDQRLESASADLNEHVRSRFDAPLLEPARSPRRSRKLALAVATAALCVISVIAVALIAPFGSDAPTVDEPTIVDPAIPAPSIATKSDSVQAAPSGATYAWIRVDDPDLGGEGYQVINSIRSVRSGLMAVGRDNDRPALWSSDDGVDWTKLEDTTGAFGQQYSAYRDESVTWLTDIADNGTRMVAVGIDLLERTGVSGELNTKVKTVGFWYSDEGDAWTRVPHDDTLFGMSAGFLNDPLRVVTTKDGFIAVGEAIWTSNDGVTWTRTELPGSEVSDAAASEAGLLLVGTIGPDGQGRFREAAWYSSDGTSWSTAGVETQPAADGTLNAVVETPDGYFGMGIASDRLAWFSEDGFTWSYRGGFEENDGYGGDRTHDAAAIGETLVVVGVRWPHAGQGATIWQSTDGGFTWTVHDDPEGVLGNARSTSRQSAANSILAFDGRFIVGGDFGNNVDLRGVLDGQGDAAVWIGTPIDS